MKKERTYKHTMRACCLGYVTQAVINNLAPLFFVIFQDAFAISFEMIGLLIMINFGTQLVVDGLCVKFADRIGHRPLMVAAHVFAALGLVCLSVLPRALPAPYVGLVVSVVIYAIGGGLIEVLVSPVADSLPGDKKAATMSLLHSFYCWGQVAVVLLSTGLLAVIGEGLWYLLPLLWAILPALNAISFLKVPLVPAIAEEHRMPLSKLLGSRVFLLAMLLMICSGASELSMSQWASLFAERGLQVSKVVGDLLGPCLFALLMGVGRTLFGLFGGKAPLPRVLLGSACLCFFCYLATSLSPSPLLALAACAVTGIAVSVMWPGVLSLSARTFETGGTAMFGLLALGGDIGCAVGPWITGLVSGGAQQSAALLSRGAERGLDAVQTGLRTGLLAAAAFPLLLFIGVLLMRRMRKA